MTIDEVHQDIANTVGAGKIAYGVHFDWLSTYFAAEIRQLAGSTQTVPTVLPQIQVLLVVNPADFALQVDSTNKRLYMTGQIDLDFRSPDGSQSYRKRKITFADTELALQADPSSNGEFRFEAISNRPTIVPPNDPSYPSPPPNSNLIRDIYNNDVNEYLRDEESVLVAGAKTIVELFAHMIPFPRLKHAMRTFLLSDVVDIHFIDDYIVVAGVPTFGPKQCPYGGSSLAEFDTELVLEKSSQASVDDGATVNLSIVPKAVMPPDCRGGLSNVLPDVLFYYPKDTTLVAWSRSIVGPAIGAQGSGGWLFTEWHYAVSAILDSIDITLNTGTMSISVTSSWTVFGSAGAGVRVPCASIDFVNVDISGTIGPVLIDVGPCIDGKVLFLRATLNGGVPHNIDYAIRPLPFPLDKIAGELLGMILDQVLMPNVAPVIDLFRIKLLDMTGMIDSLRPSRFGEHLRSASTLIGLDLSRGQG